MEGLIRSGQPWLDTNGRPIQAHGGSILAQQDGFFWYGENKERTTGRDGVWHWGVRCYTSTDLATWEDLGLIIPPDLEDSSSPLHPTQLLDRPHIISNPATGRYVCWLRLSSRSGRPQRLVALEADALLGPYTIVEPGIRPLGMDAGDFDVVVDPNDGKAYCYFERVHRELVCADLTANYTGFTGYYSTHFTRAGPPFVREAPAHFTRHDRHYLITSGTTWYFPNPSEVAIAETYHGPWRLLGDPHPSDATRTSFRSQISSVFKHPGKQDLYVALADRWLPELPDDAPHAADVMATHSASDAARLLEPYGYGADPDTSRARYVWMPFRFDGEMPYLDWRSEWRVDDFS
jgi:Glycosyl hydrolases family 43